MKTLKKTKIYNKKFFIYGHRGVPSLEEENTISSFEKAIELNYDGIELDAQMTKDKRIVVYHDIIQKNSKKKIINCSYQEILNKNKNTSAFPLLDDVLSRLGHKTIINIEIKYQSKESILIVERVIEKIKSFNLINNIIISSFNPWIIRQSKKIDDRVQTAWIWGGNNFYFYNTWSVVLNYFQPDAIHIKDTLVSKAIVHKLHLKNKAVLAYTVNDINRLTELVKLKIDGIFTDFPEVMKAGRSLIHKLN